MEAAGGVGRARWGTAAALFAGALFLSALDAIPLVTLPLGLALAALPTPHRWKWVALGALLALMGLSFPGGPLASLSRGWGLLLAGTFLLGSLWRPRWGVLPRALLALALSLAGAAAWVGATGGWSEVDALVRQHLLTVSEVALEAFRPRGEGGFQAEFATAAKQMAELQWRLFPALLALQSLAALGLASWMVARIRGADAGSFGLRPLREFRFNDQLVWVLILGLALLALPLGAMATRMGLNALLFMGGLYALRGLAVLIFLVGAAPSLFTVLLGVVAAVFLYPLVLTTTVLVGLGDTWLDIRGRAAMAPRG